MSTSTERGRNKAQPIVERAALQWANGKTEYRMPNGRFGPLVGFHIEVGKCTAFDALATDAEIARITIRHPREGAAPALVEHWSLGEAIRVYPLTYGPLATAMAGATKIADRMADEAGIVASWLDHSYLGLLVLIETAAGICPEPLVLSAKSRLTPHLYGALLAHLVMCEQADAVAGVEVPCAWIALPLVAGEEFAAGSGATTTITPVRADYDDAPEVIDAAYLSRMSLPKDVRSFAKASTVTALGWARETLNTQRTSTSPQVAAGAAPALAEGPRRGR